MRNVCVLALLLFQFVACGDQDEPSSTNEWNSLSSYADRFTPVCEALTSAIEYVQSNKSCTTNADCLAVDVGCFSSREHCSGAFYTNTAADVRCGEGSLHQCVVV